MGMNVIPNEKSPSSTRIQCTRVQSSVHIRVGFRSVQPRPAPPLHARGALRTDKNITLFLLRRTAAAQGETTSAKKEQLKKKKEPHKKSAR